MNWPLMQNNITRVDLTELRFFLGQASDPGGFGEVPVPRLTNGEQVRAFEEEFAAYIGTKYAVMVNSGASANVITMLALRHVYGPLKVAVPVICWVSDITSVMQAGHEPVFIDVDPFTMGMDWGDERLRDAQATFPTHCLGFSALPPADVLNKLPMVEDCCEALGAREVVGRNLANNKPVLGAKLGTFGLASNFSFYYAHHITTVEGGMICTSDRKFYELCRMLRGHGLLRESTDADFRAEVEQTWPDLDPQFIFVAAGYNMRPTEIQAVMGRSQMRRLDDNVAQRTANLDTFLGNLSPGNFTTAYAWEGASNYALPLILNRPDTLLLGRVLTLLRAEGVEYRRGTAGGGNQLRQPYLVEQYGSMHKEYPKAEHIHQYGLYIGNYPGLKDGQILDLCAKLNKL